MIHKIITYTGLNEFHTDENCFITELLNSEDVYAVSIAQARVAPGVTTELHTIKGTDEIYLILSDRGEVGGCGQNDRDYGRKRPGFSLHLYAKIGREKLSMNNQVL